MRRILLVIIYMISSLAVLHTQITIKYQGTLKEFLQKVQDEYGYKFMYSNDDIDNCQLINININKADIGLVLDEISQSLNLDYRIKNKQIILKNRNYNQKYTSTNRIEKVKPSSFNYKIQQPTNSIEKMIFHMKIIY